MELNHVPDEETLRKYVKAGRIAAQALNHGSRLIKESAVIRDVLDDVEAFIVKKGALPAFPAQVSLNEVAAHFCPAEDDDTAFKPTDLVKLDVGAHVDGYVGDNAVTVNLDKANEEKQRLVEASKAARDAAIALVKAGVTPHEIGRAIEREIVSRGFQPIRNLSGHGVGQYQVHTSPSIPNYGSNDLRPLLADHVVAIEPFATTGRGMIKSGGTCTLFSLAAVRQARSPQAREALTYLKQYNGLPFTTRWLSREMGIGKTRLALAQLKQAGMLHEYSPLPEESDGLVTQSEHTVLVLDSKARILTLDDE